MKRIITTFLLLIAPAAVGASELPARILIGTIATTEDTKSVSDATAYVISRVMAALTNRLGISRPLEIVPYARALTESRLHSNVIIAPLARTQRREAHYRWLIPLFDDEFVLISLSEGSAKIDSKMIVGAVRSTAMHETAESLGFAAVDAVSDDVQNVRKLLHGRIDVWLTSRNQAVKAIQYAGADPALFHFSAPVRTVTIYVAAPIGVDPGEADLWRTAGETLRADGTLDTIFKAFPELKAHQ